MVLLFLIFRLSNFFLSLMGIRRLAIEAKSFEVIVEQSANFFICSIFEMGRGIDPPLLWDESVLAGCLVFFKLWKKEVGLNQL